MRVTQAMLAANSLRNLSDSYTKIGKYQDELSTGKKITKPSDDPVVAMKGMFYRSSLSNINQYQRNLSELHLWMDNSESGLDQANSVIQRTRELVNQAQNGTLSSSDKKAVATEITQLKQELVNTANTQVAGKYIFHGTDVSNPPIVGNPPSPAQNILNKSVNPDYNVQVADGVNMKANVDPSIVFNQQMFDTMGNIETALQTNDNSLLTSSLDQLDQVADSVSTARSDLGARGNRLDLVENRINQQTVLATKVLSDNEDADIEKVITDLTTQESVHRAALSVASQIVQPSLVDFLK